MQLPRLAIVAFLLLAATPLRADDALPSWNDGLAKQAIVAFVDKVTKAGGPDFVKPEERIAVFDNDGTLWTEWPLYTQAFFALDRVKELAPQHPEWRKKQPFKAALTGDLKPLAEAGEKGFAQIIAATHAGNTPDEFRATASKWLATAESPKFKRHYDQLVYQPMLELLAYLRANGFKTYIVSGGGIEFIRAFPERIYGVPPEQVIGSSIMTKFEVADGKPQLKREAKLFFLDDKAGKPIAMAAAPSPPSAIPTAISRCCDGRPPETAPASASSCITTTRRARRPMTENRRSAASTVVSTRGRSSAGQSSA